MGTLPPTDTTGLDGVAVVAVVAGWAPTPFDADHSANSPDAHAIVRSNADGIGSAGGSGGASMGIDEIADVAGGGGAPTVWWLWWWESCAVGPAPPPYVVGGVRW
jgi:hypothetical protein